jgi:cysteine desulfurase
MPGIYLDNNSTTQMDARVLSAMGPYWTEEYGNPHSVDHSYGWNASSAIDEVTQIISDLSGFGSDEIVFTSGATEANTLAILGIALGELASKRRRILLSSIEHKSVIEAAEMASKICGVQVQMIRVDTKGALDLDHLRELMNDDVLMVCTMMVNNEIGSIQNVGAVARLVAKHGALLHVDATQCVGFAWWDSFSMADMVSFSAHKAYGPKGIGALLVRRELEAYLCPIIPGGGQQRGLRGGTLPVALCVGLAEACRLASEQGRAEEITRMSDLRDLLFHRLQERIPNIRLIGPPLHARHPGNLMIQLPDASADLVIGRVQPLLAISRASACSNGTEAPSHVLTAIGLSAEEASRCIRLATGRCTSMDDVETAAILIASAARDQKHHAEESS